MKSGRGSGIRIGAGRWKGRLLHVPPSARPTSARAREALFDILGPRLEAARVLDLYAGSGAVGIEAVSRGAAGAVLVERHPDELRRNVERLGGPAEIRILAAPADAAMRSLRDEGQRFDVVFVDPPYPDSYAPSGAPATAELPALLAPGALLVLQSDAGVEAPEIRGLLLSGAREYGRNRFAFYERVQPPKAPSGREPR